MIELFPEAREHARRANNDGCVTRRGPLDAGVSGGRGRDSRGDPELLGVGKEAKQPWMAKLLNGDLDDAVDSDDYVPTVGALFKWVPRLTGAPLRVTALSADKFTAYAYDALPRFFAGQAGKLRGAQRKRRTGYLGLASASPRLYAPPR